MKYNNFRKITEYLNDEHIKYWALYAHISDYFVNAKNSRELMRLFNSARTKYSNDPKGWPIEVIKYFYEWHLSRINDKNRKEKAKQLVKENKEYYDKISRSSNNI